MNWIKRLFKRRVRQVHPDNVDHPNPVVREIIAKAFNSGKALTGTRNDKAILTIKEVENKET
jgi:hypothetical protein